MEIKVGNIYKVVNQGNTQVGIVISIGEAYDKSPVYQLLTTGGNDIKVTLREGVAFSSTRLKPEVREALIDLHKQHQEIEKMNDQMKKIQAKLWTKRDQIQKKKEKIRLLSGEFDMSDIGQKFHDISGWSNDKKNPYFCFYIERDVAKYPQVEDFPFLYLEYDNSLHMHEDTEYITKYRIKLPDADIEQLKKKLKHSVLKSIRDEWELGDKSLYVNKVFQFSPKKGATYKELLKEAEMIQKWVHEVKEKIKQNQRMYA